MHTLGVGVVVLILAAGYAAYAGWIPSLTDTLEVPSLTTTEPPASGPGLTFDEPAAAPAVLDPAASSATATARGVRQQLAKAVKDRGLGRHLGLEVARVSAKQPLMTSTGSDLVTPASTLKLLTVVSALATMGPDHRFATTVVGGRSPRELVLVGGGDPLLTDRPADAASTTYPSPANLQQLARKTAAALRAEGIRRVRLGYDASLFRGPAINPAWEPSYIPESIVSPISALWVDEGRSVRGLALRVSDPAAVAADRFGDLLANQGIVVQQIKQATARDNATAVASVESPPLGAIVQHVVEISDNEAAEVLLRHTAIASGRPGSSAAGVRAVEETLTELGLDVSRLTMYDGSGLSRDNLVSVGLIVDVLQTAADPDHPGLRAAVSTLPVAGFTGSLDDRFVQDPRGFGVVRAKTGTLTGVHGLAGLVATADGEPLVFAAVADRVPVRFTLDARAQLERIATLLATCGCP